MAFRLIPREERFFDDFVALAEQIRVGAGMLQEMLVPDHPIWDKADEIKEVEHKCDFLTHEIIQRLHRTFVTPLDPLMSSSPARRMSRLTIFAARLMSRSSREKAPVAPGKRSCCSRMNCSMVGSRPPPLSLRFV